MFRVGQKIVCIDDSGIADHRLASKVSGWPKKGNVYTVRRVCAPDFVFDELPGLLLEEIIGQINPVWGLEYGFRSCRFRPVIEHETDISVFRALLNPANHNEFVD